MIIPTTNATVHTNLMSPPITPKLSTHVSASMSPEVVAGHDFMTLPPLSTGNTFEVSKETHCPLPPHHHASPDSPTLSTMSLSSSASPLSSSLLCPSRQKASLKRMTSAMAAMHRDHDDELGRCFQWQPFALSQPAPGIDACFSSPAFTPASDLSASSSSPPSLPPPRRPSGHCRKSIPRVCSSFSSPSCPQGSAFFLNVFDTQERQRQRDKLRRQHERRCRSSVIKISPVSSSSQSLLSDTSSPASRHACPTLPPLEKPKADTAFFDNARPDLPDHAILPPQWLPPCDAFVNRPSVRVAWKGSPLIIKSLPFYEHLHDEEISIASTLRLTPEQYLRCKRALILSAKVFYDHSVPFRKSDAQKVCRIDVNKTSCLWSAYNRLGWFTPQ